MVPAKISEEIKEANPPDKYLTEASSVWFNVGLVLTMIQPLVTIMGAFTLDNNLFSLAVFVSPFTTLAYTANVFSQPRRRGFREMWRIRLQGLLFAGISELALVVWALRTDDLRFLISSLLGFFVLVIPLHALLKLRTSIGRLPDKNVEEFIVKSIFTDSFQVILSFYFCPSERPSAFSKKVET